MGTQQTIELNGKHYDTRTGKLVSANTPSETKPPVHQPGSNSGVIDGFSKNHPPRKTHAQKAGRAVQKSNTLKRTIVKKPAHAQKADKKSSIAHHPQVTTAENLVARDPSLKTPPAIPASRLQRVKAIKKSDLITRFPSQAADTHSHHSKQTHHTSRHPANVVKAVSSVVETTADQFAGAIHSATSHDQPKPKKQPLRHRAANRIGIKSKTLNIASFAVAALLLIGFFGYQSAPNLSMRVASMRADVEGALPAYSPNGFSLNRHIQYSPGQIVVAYQSNSDERQFSITQTASQWDSETLHQNFVAKQKEVRTIQEKGKTIYLYEESNATWVDGGVWFKIEGNSKLNSEQLSRLASSL